MKARAFRDVRAWAWLCLPAVVFVLSCRAPVWAQPRTLYRPADIANARENVERYEWARSIVAGWERAVEFALEQDRDFFEALIPELTPGMHYGQTCPACVSSTLRRGDENLRWNVSEPDILTCRDCGTVYPNARADSTVAPKPPANPAQVFPGLMAGANLGLFLPRSLPT